MDCEVLLTAGAVVPPEVLAGGSSQRITETLVRGAVMRMPPPLPDTLDNRCR